MVRVVIKLDSNIIYQAEMSVEEYTTTYGLPERAGHAKQILLDAGVEIIGRPTKRKQGSTIEVALPVYKDGKATTFVIEATVIS